MTENCKNSNFTKCGAMGQFNYVMVKKISLEIIKKNFAKHQLIAIELN